VKNDEKEALDIMLLGMAEEMLHLKMRIRELELRVNGSTSELDDDD